MEHRWTTTWSWAGGDTICSKPQQTTRGEEDDEQRVGLKIGSDDSLGKVTGKESRKHTHQGRTNKLLTWEMLEIQQGEQLKSRRVKDIFFPASNCSEPFSTSYI